MKSATALEVAIVGSGRQKTLWIALTNATRKAQSVRNYAPSLKSLLLLVPLNIITKEAMQGNQGVRFYHQKEGSYSRLQLVLASGGK